MALSKTMHLCQVPSILQKTRGHPHIKLNTTRLFSSRQQWRTLQARSWKWAPAAVSAVLLGFSLGKTIKKAYEIQPVMASVVASTVPEFTEEEVALHNDFECGIWVTHEDNVYDITKFVEGHPGGSKILLAAGGPIEPFWNIYTIHNSENVREMLSDMYIGKLKMSSNRKKVDHEDPYANEPKRHPAFLLNSKQPFDAEPPPEMLVDHFITPSELFYIRNHLPVPVIDQDQYELEVVVKGREEPLKFSLHDLKTKFPKHTITATLQCAGNRRREMGSFKKIYGAPGGISAISNAEWSGVLLRDVLKHAGLKEDDISIDHIEFEGYDKDMAGEGYAASIPVDKAMSVSGDVLLAYEMNGKPVPRDHGYPVRAVVPGVIGARSVKWLRKITASDEESNSHWQQNDYKSSPPCVTWGDLDFSSVPPIYEAPVQSVICSPAPGSSIPEDEDVLRVRGYAWSGGGNGILRVDVSIDGGKTWTTADLQQIPQRRYRSWAWTLWEAHLQIPESLPEGQQLEVCCKAIDTSHNVQPESLSGIWNLRGFLNNSWHRVPVSKEKPSS